MCVSYQFRPFLLNVNFSELEIVGEVDKLESWPILPRLRLNNQKNATETKIMEGILKKDRIGQAPPHQAKVSACLKK